MAIRVEPAGVMAFGVMAAAVVVTHARFQKKADLAAGRDPVVRPLAQPLNVGAGEQLRIPATAFDVVYVAGQLTNDHMSAVVTPYWANETFQVDCMTDDSTVVADTGYSQQEHSTWAVTAEDD